MKRTATLLLLFLAGLAPADPVGAIRWNAETSRPVPYQARTVRGSTVLLEARLLREGRPVALPADTQAAFFWQTNGMGGTFWSAAAEADTNGTLRAVWTPDMDTGADAVRFFLRATTQDGADYSAHGGLRLLPGPGAEPEALPAPEAVMERVPDEAVVASAWARAVAGLAAERATEDSVRAVTNYVAEAVAELGADEPAAELHKLILADLWRRVDALEGSDGTGYVTARAVESLVADRVASEIAAERDSWTATNSIFQTDGLTEISTGAKSGVSVALDPNRAVRYYANGEAATFGIASFSGVGTHPCILILQGYQSVEWPSGAHVATGYDIAGGTDNVFRVYKLHGAIVAERICP